MIKETKHYDAPLSDEELAAVKGGQDPPPKIGDADDLSHG
jgi:bacteriocin-like protein